LCLPFCIQELTLFVIVSGMHLSQIQREGCASNQSMFKPMNSSSGRLYFLYMSYPVFQLYFHIFVVLYCISVVSVLYLVPSSKVQILNYVGIS
jgi:hypothetical protein